MRPRRIRSFAPSTRAADDAVHIPTPSAALRPTNSLRPMFCPVMFLLPYSMRSLLRSPQQLLQAGHAPARRFLGRSGAPPVRLEGERAVVAVPFERAELAHPIDHPRAHGRPLGRAIGFHPGG